MTARKNVGYVLRRLWLWPFELWLRPIALAERLRDQPTAELIAGQLGFAGWGAAAGVLLWPVNGDADAVWVFALSFAVAVVGAVASDPDSVDDGASFGIAGATR